MNGIVKHFQQIAMQPDEFSKDAREDLCLCILDIQTTLILRQTPGPVGQIEIEHFLRPPNQPIHKSAPFTDTTISDKLRSALKREIKAVSVAHRDLICDVQCEAYLNLSAQELISLCESIALQRSDVAEFWKNSCQ